MDRVRVFLRTELFTVAGADAHVPPGTCIVEGVVRSMDHGNLTCAVDAWYDARGRVLKHEPAVLILPGGKIDHMLVLGG